jgi:23S rRNA (cytidine2498-2'-O)-methyltransferase
VAGERALISCDGGSRGYAEAELRRLFPGLPPLRWLPDQDEQAVALAEPGTPYADFAGAVADADPLRAPVFVRHLAPVQIEVALSGAESDAETLASRAADLARERLDPARTFSAQTRRVEGDDAHPVPVSALNRAVAEAVGAATGALLDFRNPEQVVSVFCHGAVAYVGVSDTALNRSAWPGGQHRFRREPGQISRAEFKLLEALAVFPLDLPTSGRALDVGAAPGGWTRVLRERGLTVVAVDPADLDPALARDGGVTHVRQRIQLYRPDAPFDVLVNDLKMDAPESVAITRRLRSALVAGGHALMTLKLPLNVRPASRLLQFVAADLHALAETYTVLAARQLFHNRSEITVALAG